MTQKPPERCPVICNAKKKGGGGGACFGLVEAVNLAQCILNAA